MYRVLPTAALYHSHLSADFLGPLNSCHAVEPTITPHVGSTLKQSKPLAYHKHAMCAPGPDRDKVPV